MANNSFDPIEFALRLRKAKISGDTSDIMNYAKSMLGQPSNSSMGYGPSSMNPHQLNAYVQDMINQSFNQSLGMFHQMFDSSNRGLRNQSIKNQVGVTDNASRENGLEVFETHDSVIIRQVLPNNVNSRAVKVRTTSGRVFIRFGPFAQEETVQLPADVKKDEAKAIVRNRILEIIIPKETEANQQDISIQHQ